MTTPDRVWRLSSLFIAGILAATAALSPTTAAHAESATQPDLTLTHTMPSDLEAGLPFSVKLQLTNEGAAATANGQLLEARATLRPRHSVVSVVVSNPKFTCTIDNGQVESGSGLPVAHVSCKTRHAFEPDESAVFVIHATASQRPGPARLHARVDPDNLIHESDEQNNVAATVFVTN